MAGSSVGTVAKIEPFAVMFLQQIEGTAHAAEHAKTQHIHLHPAQVVDVVLVPFDDLAVHHRRRLNRHELVEPVARQHKSARVL